MLGKTGRIENEILVFSEEKKGGCVTAHLAFSCPSNIVIKDRNGNILKEGSDYAVFGQQILLLNRELFYYHADWIHNENVPQEIPTENELYHINGAVLVEAEYLRQTQFLADYDCEKTVYPSGVSDKIYLTRTYQKLKDQKKLKMMLFGDSISNAANSSWDMGYEGYEHWLDSAISQIEPVYDAQITWKNVSRSGYGTEWGKKAVVEKFKDENPDLVIIAFGMNDASEGMSVSTFTENTRHLMDEIRGLHADTEFILVATPIPNPIWTDGYKEQENLIHGLRSLEGEGVTVLDMTSVFLWLASWKNYIEISGNHINHPNDFAYEFYTDAVVELFLTLKRKMENRLDFTPYLKDACFERVDLSNLPKHVQAGYLKTNVNGQVRKTFAYLGMPKYGQAPYPAVVLAHGAGGNAFLEWVENWTKRGYIAMAVDLNGTHFTEGDLQNRKMNEAAGKIGVGSFDCVGKDAADSWTYYGVAQLLSAHTYLRSLPETDLNRTGIVGISWGGVLSLLAVGVDSRFLAAGIIYSAGFITEDLLGEETGLFEDVSNKQFYDTWLDPSNYIHPTNLPICFNAGLLDGAFSFLNRQRTWRLFGENTQLAIKEEVFHDNESNFENKTMFAFMDDCFLHTKNHRKVSASLRDGMCSVRYDGDYTFAEILITDAKGDNIHQLNWTHIPIKLEDGKANVAIPSSARYVMAVVFYGDELYTSSEVMENGKTDAV